MMENTNSTMAVEGSNSSLKDALCVQQRLLQQLYHELDVERESAATAASEALSMILRLQGEKAAVHMEAEQYKRLAEEKMNHAEESMEIFEEIMYQKEMVIASLDYQVQAYRYKLQSLGYDDLTFNEIKFPENLLQLNEGLVAETSSDGLARKNTPPPKRLKLPGLKKGPLEKDRSIIEDPDVIARVVEESSRDDEINQSFDLGMGLKHESSVDISSYLEQIRKLDKLVEEVAGEQFHCSTARTSRSSSVRSKLNELDHFPHRLTDEKIISDTCSASVHDVFEVPQIVEIHDSYEKPTNHEGKKSMDDKFKKLANFPHDPLKSYEKDDHYSGKKPLVLKHKEKKVFWPGEGVNVDCHLALLRPHAKSESKCQLLSSRSEIVEADTEGVERHVTSRDELELRLLYEIRDKLDSIQSDIRSRNTNTNTKVDRNPNTKVYRNTYTNTNTNTKIAKSSPNCDLSMRQLREAMMDFWF